MLRPWDKHLDSDELDQLVAPQATAVADARRSSAQALEEARRHIESCEDCSRKLRLHLAVQNEISGMSVPRNSRPGADCIEYSEWLKVAAGLSPEVETRKLIAHAAGCGYCGPLLREASAIVADEATKDEEEVLANLTTARAETQERLAETLRGSAQIRLLPKNRSSWWGGFRLGWWRPAIAGAALVVIAIAAWLGTQRPRPSSAEQLLAQAYTERRPFEARIPGAGFAPIRTERLANKSNFDRPAALSEAEGLIARNLAKHPNDLAWSQAKARADLLDGNYDSAIDSLERARERRPASAELLADLGTAYYLRGKSENRPSDFGRAVDILQLALDSAHNDPIALFNRALACEAALSYDCAIDDWQRYLQVDPTGPWAEEARKRLADVRSKKQARENELRAPLLRPEDIGSIAADASVRDQVDEHIEEYLKQAVSDWLPAAYTQPPSAQTRQMQAALRVLSDLARERHGDTWLADLLSHVSGTQFPAAVQALSSAVKDDKEGDYAGAHDAAARASHLFRTAGNPAGEVRAEAEQVYSDQLLWEGEQCLVLLKAVAQQLHGHDWVWIRGQMSLEQSNCSDQVGDLGTYHTAIVQGVKEAEAHHYTALYLRGVGFQSLAAASLGDADTAFVLAAKGLQRFWSGYGDLMSGYNLYANLDAAADDLHLTNFQVVLWQQATELIDEHPDTLQRAMAHRWYGKSAYQANMPSLASAEFARASDLFKHCKPTIATTRDYMDAEVWLANAEIRQGDLNSAAATLQEVKPMLNASPSFDPEIGYYSAQADIALRRGDAAASESAVRSAVFLANWALTSLPSEGDRRHWAEQTRDAYAGSVEWKLRQGDSRAALELWEWYRGAEYGATQDASSDPAADPGVNAPPDAREAPPLPSPAMVSTRLPLLRSETVVAYAIFPAGIAVWTYDDRGIFSRWIGTPSPTLQRMVLQFARLCADRNSDLATLRAAGAALYSALLAPVEDHLLPGRTLVFEPDDFLEAVPWEALVNGGGHYLAEKFPVVVSSGLYRSSRLRPATRITAGTPALVVSVPVVPEERVTPLPDANREAEAVEGRFYSAYWLAGSNATLSALREQMSGAAVFHFAGHAIASPERSGLMLAELDPQSQRARVVDGRSFTAAETAHLQLVVLSACHTGAEAQPGTSGTESLAQALLQDRVPHVVVSRWNIDSSKTADLMKQFYANVLAGAEVAKAMNAAQLALASQPDSIHPYYWAAFEVQGSE